MSGLSGQIVYVAETQHVMFPMHDPVFGTDEPLHLSVIVEGVYSTVARAEAALDARINRLRGVHVVGALQTAAIGGVTTDHGGACQWARTVRWEANNHPPVDAWQQVRAVKVDQT